MHRAVLADLSLERALRVPPAVECDGAEYLDERGEPEHWREVSARLLEEPSGKVLAAGARKDGKGGRAAVEERRVPAGVHLSVKSSGSGLRHVGGMAWEEWRGRNGVGGMAYRVEMSCEPHP